MQLSFVESSCLMVFDIYIPSLNLIFEYHGYQHYSSHCMFGDVTSRQERDNQKRAACNFLNVTFLEVPYWWQHDKESIIALIHQERPDIVPCILAAPFQYLQQTYAKSRKYM